MVSVNSVMVVCLVKMWGKGTPLVVVLLMMSVKVESSQQVIKQMTKNFMKAFEVCANEYNLPKESTVSQMINFWKEDFTSTSRDLGCAIFCLSTKLDLIEPDGKLHHGKATEFAIQHGSDEAMAKQLVSILHVCEDAAAGNDDKCMKALDITLCFKKELHKLNWAPDPELLFEEMIAEL